MSKYLEKMHGQIPVITILPMVLIIGIFSLPQSMLHAAWNSVSGIKDGSDTASELASPWDGERLLAFGGTLNFAGDVNLDGELWMQQLNGWGNPVVNIPGALTMNSPSGQFTVVAGADLNIGSPGGSSITAGFISIRDGATISLNEMIVHDNFNVGNVASLHILTDFEQDGGDFVVNQNSTFTVDGTFTKTGNGRFEVNFSDTNFVIGNPAGSSVEAGVVSIRDGIDMTLNEMIVHDNFNVGNVASLHILTDFEQDGGDFVVNQNSTFTVDGTFTKTGNGRFEVNFSDTNFVIGNPAGSSVEAGVVSIRDGIDMTLNEMIVHDNFNVGNVASLLILTDFEQDGGNLYLLEQGSLRVDGTFTKTGNGEFQNNNGSSLQLANPSSSSVEAGYVRIADGVNVTIGDLITHGNLEVLKPSTVFQLLGDYTQDAGNLYLIEQGTLRVDGTFTKTGNGEFQINNGSSLQLANPSSSSVEAGYVRIADGVNVTIGDLITHGNLEVLKPSTVFQLLGDYTQDAGNLYLIEQGTLRVDGTFTKTGNGEFQINNGSSLQLANPSSSSVEAGYVRIADGVNVTIGDLITHGNLEVLKPSTVFQLLGDYTQDDGNFVVFDSATMTVDGAFNYTAGNTIEVRNNAVLTSSGTGASVANFVNVHSGGKATIGNLTAHGTVNVQNPTSMLRVGGDYLQDAGGIAIGDNATLNVDGSFRYAVPGSQFINFGNGLLTVGNTLTLEEGHFWNLAASLGKVRVGEGVVVPTAGTVRVTDNGTLAGEGTVVGDVINTGGTISPGFSPGRLDVTGNYTQGAIAELLLEIGGPLAELQYDQLFVSGTASLAGSLTVDLIDLGMGEFQPLLGQTFDILKAGGGRSGTFANVTFPTLGAGLDWQLNYLANRVQLEVIAATSSPGDFDLDGDVDGRDFLAWQRDPGVGDLADWQANYGNNAPSAAVSVPEPGALVFFVLFPALIVGGRTRLVLNS